MLTSCHFIPSSNKGDPGEPGKSEKCHQCSALDRTRCVELSDEQERHEYDGFREHEDG